jgi:hypothetical protein
MKGGFFISSVVRGPRSMSIRPISVRIYSLGWKGNSDSPIPYFLTGFLYSNMENEPCQRSSEVLDLWSIFGRRKRVVDRVRYTHWACNLLHGESELCYNKTRLQIKDPTGQTLDSRVEGFVKHVSALRDQHGTRGQTLTICVGKVTPVLWRHRRAVQLPRTTLILVARTS